MNTTLIKTSADYETSSKEISAELMPIMAALEMISIKIDTASADLKGSLTLWIVVVGLLQMTLIIGVTLKLAH